MYAIHLWEKRVSTVLCSAEVFDVPGSVEGSGLPRKGACSCVSLAPVFSAFISRQWNLVCYTISPVYAVFYSTLDKCFPLSPLNVSHTVSIHGRWDRARPKLVCSLWSVGHLTCLQFMLPPLHESAPIFLRSSFFAYSRLALETIVKRQGADRAKSPSFFY